MLTIKNLQSSSYSKQRILVLIVAFAWRPISCFHPFLPTASYPSTLRTTRRSQRRATQQEQEQEQHCEQLDRRDFLSRVEVAAAISSFAPSQIARAADENLYTRTGQGFTYTFQPPIGFEASNKPLKTHFDEISFVSQDVKGYQYGITVDPVRISSLQEFGTPEEVAARVVTAEVNRDGVFDVTLLKDPVVVPSDGSYILDYLSKGKRGDKHYICKITIANGKLFVLTAQAKEESYPEKADELNRTVQTFTIVS